MRFGEFELDEGRRQLLRAGAEIHLPPKMLQLLQLLIERAPNAISKQEIYEHLWPKTFVSAVNLPGLIGDLRTALGDDARQSRFIRTVHGFGYAFCGATTTDQAKPAGSVAARLMHDRGEIRLHYGENVIGRDAALPCSIDHHSVSRRHASITCSDDGAAIRDLESKNGTALGGLTVEGSMPLRDGDRVQIGSVELTFSFERRDPATATVTRAGNRKQ